MQELRIMRVFLINMHISSYDNGNIFNHDETRERKLTCLHKKEILKFRDKIKLEGYTLVPLKVYLVRWKGEGIDWFG